MMRKGIGPNPKEKEATNAITAILAIIGEELMESESRSEKRPMQPMESSSSGLRPTRCEESRLSCIIYLTETLETYINEVQGRESLQIMSAWF